MGRGGRKENAVFKGQAKLRRTSPGRAAFEKGFNFFRDGHLAEAEDAWLEAVRQEPTMADGWLGLHALKPSSFYYLNQIFNNIDNLGKTQSQSGKMIHSHYAPIWFYDQKLSSRDSVILAMARSLSGHNQSEKAAQLLTLAKPSPDKDAVQLRISFNEGRYQDCVEQYQKTEWADEHQFDAKLLAAISLSRLGVNKPSADMLKAAVKEAPDQHAVDAARYQLALSYERAGKESLARQELELVAASDINFLDVAERLGINNPEPEMIENKSSQVPELDSPDETAKWSQAQQAAAEQAGFDGIDFGRLADQ